MKTDWFENIFILSILLIVVVFVSAVFNAPYPTEQEPKDIERIHLPSKCAEYYNTGTDDWVRCMYVEYK